MAIDLELPLSVEVRPLGSDGSIPVKELGELTIAGYVELPQYIYGIRDVTIPQPLILYNGRPATTPFRFETAEDHTYYTLDRPIKPRAYSENETALAVVSNVSRVIVPDEKTQEPFAYITGNDIETWLGFASYGDYFRTAHLFDQPIPYDETALLSVARAIQDVY